MSQLDFPTNPIAGDTYVAPNGVTYEWNDSIGIGVWEAVTSPPFAISSAGIITGTPQVGSVLTYTQGSYIGGEPTVNESWIWKKVSDGSTLQNGGLTYTITSALIGQQVYVEYTVSDASPTTLTADTADYPSFGPITAAGIPTTIWNPTPLGAMTSGIPGTSSAPWQGAGGTITATGCVEVSTDGTNYFASVPVTTSQTLYQRWKSTSGCGGAASGTPITGTVSNGTYTNTYNISVDRVPAAIANISDSNVSLGATVTKPIASAISGINTTAYVTYVGTSTGTVIQAATAPGGPFTTLATSGNGFPVTNGQTLYIRQTVGGTTSTPYTAIIRVGDGTNTAGTYTEFTFTATTTSSAGFPNLPSSLQNGPTSIPQTVSGTWADGNTSVTSTGCLQISLNGTSWGQGPLTMSDGLTLYQRWIPTGATCGEANSGTSIGGTLTDGTYTESYSLTLDRTPAAITFTAASNVPLSSVETSNVVTLSDTNAPAYLTYDASSTGDSTTYFATVNGVGPTAIPAAPSTSLPVPPGASLSVRQTAASTVSTTRDLVVKLGNSDGTASITATFSVDTTSTATFPNTSFTPSAGPTASPSATNLSTPSLFGVASTTNWSDGITSISATGDLLFRIPPAAFGQTAVTVNPGDTVELAWDNAAALAAASGTGTLTGTLTNGTYTNSYSLTVDKVSDSYGWQDLTLQAVSSTIQSNTVTITGLNCPAELICTPDPTNPLGTVKASINNGPFTTVPTSAPGLVVNPANNAGTTETTIQLEGVTGSGTGVAYKVTTELGFGTNIVTDEWSVTTSPVTPTVAQPTVINPSGSSLNPAGGLTLQGDSYVGNNSPGAHNSSDWQLLQMGVTSTNPETSAIVSVAQNSSTSAENTGGFATNVFGRSIAYSPTLSKYVATGYSTVGVVSSSSDGVNWTLGSLAAPTSVLTGGIAWGQGKFITAGGYGDVFSSTNGTSFTSVGTATGFVAPYDSQCTFYNSTLDQWLIAGSGGVISTSPNGTTWTDRTAAAGFGGSNLPQNSVTANIAGLYVVVGGSGKIATSPDGVTWTQRTSGVATPLRGVAYGNGTFVVGTNSGGILTSADGITWSSGSASPAITTSLFDIRFNGTQFVAIGSGTPATMATSPDGVTWTAVTTGGTINLTGLYASGNTVIGIGGLGGGSPTTNKIWTGSLSTTTLTLASASGLANMQVGDTLVEVGGGADATGTITAINAGTPSVTVMPSSTNWTTTATAKDTSRTISTVDTVLISTNTISGSSTTPVSWTSRTSGTANILLAVTYANSKYVAVGGVGTILTSPDGITWTSRSSGTTGQLYGVAYGNSKYATVGISGDILTSPDGTSWTSQTGAGTNGLLGITYGNSQFVAVGANSSNTAGVILTSPDGTTWTSQTSGTANPLSGVTYANSQYVVVGDSGTILTSSNGTSWTGQSSGTANKLRGIVYGNSLYVAVGLNGTIVTSPNGTTWTSRTSGTTNFLNGVVYGNGQFIVTGQNGTILVSPDGITWTAQTSGTTSELRYVTYGTTQFVTVGASGTILTSTGTATSNLTISAANTDGFAVGNLISNGLTGGTAAFGIITAINGTSVSVAPSSANWANGQNLYRGKTIVNADDDTGNLTTYLVPGSDFLAATTYNARVRYNSINNPPIYTSPWSNWKTFGTA